MAHQVLQNLAPSNLFSSISCSPSHSSHTLPSLLLVCPWPVQSPLTHLHLSPINPNQLNSRKLHESPSRLEEASEHPITSFPALFRVWHYLFLHITIWSMPTSVITDCQVHGAMPMPVSFTMCSLVSVQNSTDAQTVDWEKKKRKKWGFQGTINSIFPLNSLIINGNDFF